LNSIETAVQGIKEGNTQSFELIIEQFQQQLFRYCYRMLGNTHEAEDAVQESFLKAYEKIRSYNKSISFSAWLYRITYNHCINIIRRKKLLKFTPFLEEKSFTGKGMEERLEENELNKLLNDALDKISPKDRCIIISKNIEEKSFEEIGIILDMKPATVRKRYERLRNKLKFILAQNEGGMLNERCQING
jgi:RNA polymerase sigma-70 factor (ECF subfamily)